MRDRPSHVGEVLRQTRLSIDHRHGQRAALGSFYQWCVDSGLVSTSPAALLPKVKAGQPRPRPAPDQVWSDLLASARPREALMALLACQAGLRRAEVAGLHFDDLIRDQSGWCLIVHGKGGKQGVVPITARLAEQVREYCHSGYVLSARSTGTCHRMRSADWSAD